MCIYYYYVHIIAEVSFAEIAENTVFFGSDPNTGARDRFAIAVAHRQKSESKGLDTFTMVILI